MTRRIVNRYIKGLHVIRSFKDRVTEAVFRGQCPKGFSADIFPVARRKLGVLNAAPSLNAFADSSREPA